MENKHTFRPVTPVAPAAAYMGGKRLLAPHIISLIDQVDHGSYIEPFMGMGGVFLRRNRAPRVEVINDISGDVAGFFRVLQRHYVHFMDMLKWQLTSRREFERLVATDPATLTDLERAARFVYLQRTTYGGKVKGRVFGVSPRESGSFDVTKLGLALEAIHERLSGVIIESLPYDELITRYDTPETLFYLDPPYWGCEKDYGPNVFSRDDFTKMAALLGSIEGVFILSINDTPEVRDVFASFPFEPVRLKYSIGASHGSHKDVGELIFRSERIKFRQQEAMF